MPTNRYRKGDLLVMICSTPYVSEPGCPHFVLNDQRGTLDAGTTVLALCDEFDFTLRSGGSITAEPYIMVLTPEGKRAYMDPRRAQSLTRDEGARKIPLQELLHQ